MKMNKYNYFIYDSELYRSTGFIKIEDSAYMYDMCNEFREYLVDNGAEYIYKDLCIYRNGRWVNSGMTLEGFFKGHQITNITNIEALDYIFKNENKTNQ